MLFLKRLSQEVNAAAGDRFPPHGLTVESGYENDGQRRALGFEAPTEVHSRLTAEVNIKKEAINSHSGVPPKEVFGGRESEAAESVCIQ